MSVDYKVYVGPYIEVHNPMKVITEEYYTCSNKGCLFHGKHVSTKFCAECGSQVTLQGFPTKTRIKFNVYSEFKSEPLAEAFRGYSSNPDGYEDYNFYIPNLKDAPGFHFDPTRDGTQLHDLDDINLSAERLSLLTKFTAEVHRMMEIFGEQNVKIKWGIMSWAW